MKCVYNLLKCLDISIYSVHAHTIVLTDYVYFQLQKPRCYFPLSKKRVLENMQLVSSWYIST